jgi:hypothetical protein
VPRSVHLTRADHLKNKIFSGPINAEAPKSPHTPATTAYPHTRSANRWSFIKAIKIDHGSLAQPLLNKLQNDW